jgi:hypothetical protein
VTEPSHIEDWHDVLVGEARERQSLAKELMLFAIPTLRRCDELQGDVAAKTEVACVIHDPETAPADAFM